ncbi:hypothetical protein GCM10023185_16700 [Hymenobacter saemangeumensis]|uniref:Histidine kinase n=1 Tax=Hymenobacter saemangeumensis TaxID=1084522 RepID=A0ABP8IAH6_9BACT
MALSHLDFQQARIKQVLFKSRLRSVLYGVREAEPELFSVAHSPLGEWIQTVVKARFGTSAQVRELERLLKQMLDKGQELAALYQRGKIEEARAGLEQIDGYSRRIELALQSLERESGS